MAKVRSNVVAALDIGSSKVVCFIAVKDGQGKLKIVGIGHQISQGVRSGLITDISAAEHSILTAISAAENMCGQTIDSAIVNISGNSIESHNLNVETNVSGHEVTDTDLSHIASEAYKNYSTGEKEVIHCIPIDYSIDDVNGIKDPRKMYGNVLSTNLHMVSASGTYLRNLASCLAICRLNIEDCIVSAYASGIACLTEDEKQLGCTVIDIGGGSTSIGIFLGGNMIHTESISIGGQHITKDLARGLSTSIAYAERIKTLYGSTFLNRNDREEVIDVPMMSDTIPPGTQLDIEANFSEDTEISHISKAEIVSIIQPRVEEILEMVKKSLENKGLEKMVGGRIVLTGGTSQLAGIKELASEIFKRHVRIGRPFQIDGLAEATKGAAFSSAIGMLQYAAKRDGDGGLSLGKEKSKRKKPLAKILGWFEENF